MDTTSEIIIYQTEDGQTDIEVRLENESVWLTLNQIADLFQTTKQNISLHLKNIYVEGELERGASVKENLTVQKEGRREVTRRIEVYNLDAVISVGYRVKSHVATRFRIWATQKLKEFIIKGFVMDDERLKQNKSGYFDELIERVRDIRSSERIFWQKVLDIYASSIDYDPSQAITQSFFAMIQNKFHWAIHGHTAAELIVARADAMKPNMGLTNWSGSKIRPADVKVAKNYLKVEELEELNLLVDQYLSFAELQAKKRKLMYMKDWIDKLHGFFTLNEHDILLDAGKVQRKFAEEHALNELAKYRELEHHKDLSTAVQQHFEEAMKRLTDKRKNLDDLDAPSEE